MRYLLGAVTSAVAVLSLLTILACVPGEEGETTPIGAATPTSQAVATPTIAQEEGEATPTGAATATPQVTPTPTPQPEAVEMGIDPDTSGNTASALGALESCVRLDVPSLSFDGVSDYSIDVYVRGDTQAPIAYDAWVTYDLTKVHIASPGTSTLIKLPGATDFSNALPDSDGMFISGAGYLSGGPGIAGDGALVRLGLDIGGSGVVTFGFEPRSGGTTYVSLSGAHPLTRKTAQLAINTDCPQ